MLLNKAESDALPLSAWPSVCAYGTRGLQPRVDHAGVDHRRQAYIGLRTGSRMHGAHLGSNRIAAHDGGGASSDVCAMQRSRFVGRRCGRGSRACCQHERGQGDGLHGGASLAMRRWRGDISEARSRGAIRALERSLSRWRDAIGTGFRGLSALRLRRRQEKSRLADQAASVLVGCQGFEPWTY